MSMRSNLSLGRIAGIQIGVNWSWLVIFALLTWTLGAVIFPDRSPDLAGATLWAMAVVASVLFFASILLHELGHALQARRDDVRIDGITLWLFGGVARFRDMYRTPGAEFRIAVAGPLVTAAIALGLWALSAAPLGEAVDGVVTWLAYINVVLLVFNLLPALPLDGGRLLHAGLWRLKGDLVWATRVGAAIGMGFGYLMLAGGAFLFFATPGVGGLWLAFIGWFVATAARAEAGQIVAREALGDARVEDLMSRDPVTVEPDMTIQRFVDDVAGETRFTSYPVVEGGRPVGLLRFERATGVPAERRGAEHVGDHMTPREDVPALRPDQSASEALEELAGGDAERTLVVEDDRLVGILSVTDVRRAVQVRAGAGSER